MLGWFFTKKRQIDEYISFRKRIKTCKYSNLNDDEKAIQFSKDMVFKKDMYKILRGETWEYQRKYKAIVDAWIERMEQYGNYPLAITELATTYVHREIQTNDHLFSNKTQLYLDQMEQKCVLQLLSTLAKSIDDTGWNSESYSQPVSNFKETLKFHRNTALRGNIASYELYAKREHYCGDMMRAMEYYKLSYLLGNEFTIKFMRERYNTSIEPTNTCWWESRIKPVETYIEQYDELEMREKSQLNILTTLMCDDVAWIITQYLGKDKTFKQILNHDL